MSMDHEEETMFADLLEAGEDPKMAAALAAISRDVAETMTRHPERWMRARIDAARALHGPCPPDSRGGQGSVESA